MYGAALTRPTIQLSRSPLGSPRWAPMPNSWGKERFAPFEPVWSQPLRAREGRMVSTARAERAGGRTGRRRRRSRG